VGNRNVVVNVQCLTCQLTEIRLALSVQIVTAFNVVIPVYHNVRAFYMSKYLSSLCTIDQLYLTQ
jgi:hypothetical protein